MSNSRSGIGFILITLLALSTSLITAQAGVQADSIRGPGDNVTGKDNQTAVPMAQNLGPVYNNANTGGVLVMANDYILINVDCWHTATCAVCGGLDYGCSNMYGFYWVPSCPFTDPLPCGKIITRVEAEVLGVACSQGPTQIFINDTYIGQETHPGHCECNACYSRIVSSPAYASGLPGYVYGGANNLVLNIAGETCISEVRLKMYMGNQSIGTSASHSSTMAASSLPQQQPVVNPVLTVQNASISQAQSTGEPVTVSATVANTSTVTGTAVVRLYINEQEAENRAVTVAGGKTMPIAFTLSGYEPGTYSVYVNTVPAGNLTVDAAGNKDIFIYGVILLLALGIAGALYFLVRKRAA